MRWEHRARLAAMISTGAIAGSAALAGPLNRAWVAADAKWVVHVDVEAATRTSIGKRMAQEKSDLIPALAEFKQRSGVDLFDDVKDVTAYGTVLDSDDGVILVKGTEKIEKAVDTFSRQEKSATQEPMGDKTVFRWREGKSDRFAYLKRGKGETDRILIVAGSKDSISHALTVMDGGANIAAVTEGAIAAKPVRGSVLFIAMRDIDSASQSFGPKVLRAAKEMTADFGEDDQGLFGDVVVKTDAPENVRNMVDFMKGLLAMGKMASQADPSMACTCRLLDAITFEARDANLVAKFRIPKDQLTALMDEVIKEHGPTIQKTSTTERPSKETAEPLAQPAPK